MRTRKMAMSKDKEEWEEAMRARITAMRFTIEQSRNAIMTKGAQRLTVSPVHAAPFLCRYCTNSFNITISHRTATAATVMKLTGSLLARHTSVMQLLTGSTARRIAEACATVPP